MRGRVETLMAGQDAQAGGALPAGQEALLWAVRLGLALTLVIPLVVTPGTIFPYVVGKALFGRVVIEITFACWMALLICRREYRPAWSWVLLAAAAWLLVSLLAGIAGVSLTRSLWSTYERMQGVVELAHWTAFIVMAASVLRSHSDWRLFFALNLALCAVVSALGLGQHYGLVNTLALASEGRIASTLGNATYLGTYTLISALLGLGLMCHSAASGRWIAAAPASVDSGTDDSGTASGRRRRWDGMGRHRIRYRNLLPELLAPGLAILIIGWALWLSGTRGALVGWCAGAAALALTYVIWGRGRGARIGAGVLLAALLTLAAVYILAGDPAAGAERQAETNTMAARIASAGTADDSVQGRMIAIRAGIAAWREQPLLGWGPENFLIAWGQYVAPHPPGLQQFDQAHSKVAEVLATTGAIGLLSYLALWAAMGWAMLRAFRRAAGADRALLGILGATMVSYWAQHLFLFDTPGTAMLFGALAAFAVSEEWRGRRQPTAAPAASRVARGRRRRPALPSLPLWSALPTLPRRLRVAGAIGLTLLLIGLAAASAAFTVAPIYAAAQAALPAGNAARPWTERAGLYRWATQQFPGLANYLRIYFIGQAAVLPDEFGGPELAGWSDVVRGLGQDGLAVEPANWRLHAALAGYYQAAVARAPRYLELAQRHTDAAVRLAPNVPEVIALRAGLERLERQAAASYAVDANYADKSLTYTKNPCADEHTEPEFMLHIFPVNAKDVPAAQSEHGFDNRDFVFSNHGVRQDGECTVRVALPEYDISHIETGQYWSGADDLVWQITLYDEN